MEQALKENKPLCKIQLLQKRSKIGTNNHFTKQSQTGKNKRKRFLIPGKAFNFENSDVMILNLCLLSSNTTKILNDSCFEEKPKIEVEIGIFAIAHNLKKM
ncbi:hypothetical protein [Cloacibacterium sp.]|uniref:hypothetical protein n=1 Tax=Cloacibacterium sp. TaxID=1913682 RepID=UPI0039E544AB